MNCFIHNFPTKMFRQLLRPSSGWYYYKNTKVHILLVVSSSQLTILVPLYSYNNVTLKMAAIADENILVRKLWMKYIINIQVIVVGYLYVMDLISALKTEHTKIIWIILSRAPTVSSIIQVECKILFTFPVLAVPPVLCATCVIHSLSRTENQK